MTIKTSKAKIIEWAMSNLDETRMGAHATEFGTHCWRCGCKRKTERCHVIPDSLGGPDTPSNFRLLCNACHQEAPNVNDPNAMDDWIEETRVSQYETFWTLRLMESWKGDSEISQLFSGSFSEEEILEEIKSILRDETSVHWGHPETNASTKTYVLKKTYRNLVGA